jgi:hypothetical protein
LSETSAFEVLSGHHTIQSTPSSTSQTSKKNFTVLAVDRIQECNLQTFLHVVGKVAGKSLQFFFVHTQGSMRATFAPKEFFYDTKL